MTTKSGSTFSFTQLYSIPTCSTFTKAFPFCMIHHIQWSMSSLLHSFRSSSSKPTKLSLTLAPLLPFNCFKLPNSIDFQTITWELARKQILSLHPRPAEAKTGWGPNDLFKQALIILMHIRVRPLTVLWCSGLNLCLLCQYSIWASVLVLAAPLPI